MKNPLQRLPALAFALSLSAAATVAGAPAVARAATFPYPLQNETLPNGLRVVFVPMDTPGLFAYFTLVRVGSRNEVETGHTGFAHFFEHMMFRGTAKYPEEALRQLVLQLGLHSNAFTWDDETVYFYSGPKLAINNVIEMEADRFQHLKYNKPEFQTEAKAVLGEYNKNFSNPAEKMEEVLLDNAFQKHTYKHTTMGFKPDILKMPDQYDYSISFFNKFYRPDACTIFVIGDFDHDSVKQKIVAEYGGWSGKSAEPSVAVEPPQKSERTAKVDWPTDTKPRLMVGWHDAAAGTKDAAVAKVLGPYLFGASSPLWTDLVLTRQLIEGFDVSYMGDDPRPGHRDPRLFSYLATLKKASDLPEVARSVDAAVTGLKDGAVDEQRLKEVKEHLRYSLLSNLEAPEEVGELLSLYVAPTGDIASVDQQFDLLSSVSAEDLKAFAKKYLVDTNRTVITLSAPAGGGK